VILIDRVIKPHPGTKSLTGPLSAFECLGVALACLFESFKSEPYESDLLPNFSCGRFGSTTQRVSKTIAQQLCLELFYF